jgi:biotin transport system substrate-specific component
MTTLTTSLWPATTPHSRFVKDALLALVGTLLLTVSAKIQFPFWPVPMTMQTYVVLVLAMAYGWRLGTLTMLLYLAQGALGLPVFAGTPDKGIGLPYMLGPTGGYLVGFVVAAAVTGWLAERGFDRTFTRAALAMAIGHVIVFAFGFAWLATLIGTNKAWIGGVAPFWAATLFKTVLGLITLPLAWKLTQKLKP